MALNLESAVLRKDHCSDLKDLISISNVQNLSYNLLYRWCLSCIYLVDQSSTVCANRIGIYLMGQKVKWQQWIQGVGQVYREDICKSLGQLGPMHREFLIVTQLFNLGNYTKCCYCQCSQLFRKEKNERAGKGNSECHSKDLAEDQGVFFSSHLARYCTQPSCI